MEIHSRGTGQAVTYFSKVTKPRLGNILTAFTPPGSNFGPALTPGAFVTHPDRADWGIGQVQSVNGVRITVNFENAGKQLINGAVIALLPADPDGAAGA